MLPHKLCTLSDWIEIIWQATFFHKRFVEVMGGPGRAGLQCLPKDVLRDILCSEELETQSELLVFEACFISALV